MRILICDDEKGRRERWEEQLRELLEPDHQVVSISRDFGDHYRVLTQRRERARGLRSPDATVPLDELPLDDDWTDTDFDAADVLLVDYDLFNFAHDNYLTGAIVAYLARCFSRCRTIVSVNEFGPNPFDLTLAGNPMSFADVTIGELQLSNPALWFGFPSDESSSSGFRPWTWQPLLDHAERQAARAQAVIDRLEEQLVDVTGLRGHGELLPRSTIGLLGLEGARATLADVARGPQLGLRRGDEPGSKLALARIAAASGARWLERVVLPLQDVLIDAPHLVQRNAALLDTEDVETANWSVTSRLPATHEACGLRPAALKHRHLAPLWLARPAFIWPGISTDSEVPGVADPFATPAVDTVFCEDVSAFIPRAQARRFVSKLDSSSPVRWIADPDQSGLVGLHDVEYQPRARLAM